MLDKDTFKRELVRMWNTLRDDKYKIYNACNGVSCNKCPLNGIGCSEPLSSYEIVEIIKKWSKEHPPKKFKVSKLEYDIMRAAIDYSSEEEAFKDVDILYELLINGYFKGAKSSDKVIDFFKNCEVVEE